MQIKLDDTPVRFTSDGKLYIVDAIAALTMPHHSADDLWKSLKTEKPQVKDFIDYEYAKDAKPLPITDSEGWDHIQDHLFDYLIEKELQ